MRGADSSGLGLSSGDSHAWSAHDDEEVHTEDTDSRVVLDTEVDVLLDTETEVSSLGEVSAVSTGARVWVDTSVSSAGYLPPSTPASRRQADHENTAIRRMPHACQPSTPFPLFPQTTSPSSATQHFSTKNPNSNSPLPQLVLLDLQGSLQNLLRLGTSDSDVDGNLLVPSDAERSDGVSGLGRDGGLTGELLEHLGGSGQPVSGFTNGDVCGSVLARRLLAVRRTDDELLDPEILHRVDGGGLVGLDGKLPSCMVRCAVRPCPMPLLVAV